MFRSNFEKHLESATSHLRLEPDWPSILLICDEINQKDTSPKTAFAAIKKKMGSPNPHSACYALLVLESVVKNCGVRMHEEVFTKENCEMFSLFLETTPHENVRQKMLELVQTWAYAFRSSEKYQAIKDTMTILKTKGHTFPELKEADAMFTADTAPNWSDGRVCHRCRVEFTFTNRKHHCRNCGQVFCGQCTAKQCPLPKYGIEKDVRVCDGCFASLQRPSSAKANTRAIETDLPVEYLNSSLAQQVQTPARKTEQELKEEEDLQLALALSQSEAEQKKQSQQTKQQQSLGVAALRSQQRSPSPEAPPAPRELQQQEQENPDLAKYLNRSYWEQRKVSDSPMNSPSAPSPMPTPQPQPMIAQQKCSDEVQIDEFSANMRTQVEIFVNRMKSNSSRGRSIANDSSVQTLFMTLTAQHSQLLSHIKQMDDKRMWYEQLQDKFVQIKDSRAALDVLRQEHIVKLREIAEKKERERQMLMAAKLEIMRKKKQEYLQYQRQLALQRIQEQEREMQMRQEQQKAQYRMGQTAFPFMTTVAPTGASPSHQLGYNPYAYNPNPPMPNAQYNAPGQPVPTTIPGMFAPGMVPPPTHNQHSGMLMQGAINSSVPMMPPPPPPNNPIMATAGPLMQQQLQQQQPTNLPSGTGGGPQLQQQQHLGVSPLAHVMLQQHHHQQQQQQQQQNLIHPQPPLAGTANHAPAQGLAAIQGAATAAVGNTNALQMPAAATSITGNAQMQAVGAAPSPPITEPEPPTPSATAVPTEPATAELISFD